MTPIVKSSPSSHLFLEIDVNSLRCFVFFYFLSTMNRNSPLREIFLLMREQTQFTCACRFCLRIDSLSLSLFFYAILSKCIDVFTSRESNKWRTLLQTSCDHVLIERRDGEWKSCCSSSMPWPQENNWSKKRVMLSGVFDALALRFGCSIAALTTPQAIRAPALLKDRARRRWRASEDR